MVVCELCKAIVVDETTVGNLINEGDVLRREGRLDGAKLMQAMEKYYAAWKVLSQNEESHPECVSRIDSDYKDVFRTIQGSRA